MKFGILFACGVAAAAIVEEGSKPATLFIPALLKSADGIIDGKKDGNIQEYEMVGLFERFVTMDCDCDATYKETEDVNVRLAYDTLLGPGVQALAMSICPLLEAKRLMGNSCEVSDRKAAVDNFRRFIKALEHGTAIGRRFNDVGKGIPVAEIKACWNDPLCMDQFNQACQ